MPSAGVAGVRLECTAESRSGAALALDVVAVNAGDEPARDVRPEVVYAHQTYSGEAAALDPGARREWQIPLAPPGAPGPLAATAHVHYLDALARGDARAPRRRLAARARPVRGGLPGRLVIGTVLHPRSCGAAPRP